MKPERPDTEPRIRVGAKEATESYQAPRTGLIFLQVLIVVFLAAFVSRFYYLQILHGAEFAVQAQNNHWREESISAPRGRILDQRGRILADNRTTFGLSLVRDDVRDLAATLAQVSVWTGMPIEKVEERYRQTRLKVKSFEPLLLASDLDFDLVARIESELCYWPGLEILVLTRRNYPEKDLFAHILGYVAEANEKELEEDSGLAMGDLVGKSGIELSMEKRLRGRKGISDIEVDASGHMVSRVLREEPQMGRDLVMSIDRDIQKACWDALGSQAGSIIVMEPDTGKLRGMVTAPAYDNNLFAGGISHRDWNVLRNSPRFPLQNRVLQSAYPPGSVWKLVMAGCFLENGVSPQTSVFCSGATKLGNQIFRCWKHSGHGQQNLEQALINSCDVYFYLIAEKIGINKIEEFARASGFGAPTGIDLPGERSGLVPSREWKKRRHKRAWTRGDTFNTSIGQGYTLTTPLQMAVYVSALLNGGDVLKPLLLESDERVVRSRIPAGRDTLAQIVRAMRRTAAGGTARVVGRKDADMGGKTGTAQVVKLGKTRPKNETMAWKQRDHAWIATWGHKGDRTYVVIVMVEHGGGGSSVAGPIAAKVYDFLFSNPRYTSPPGIQEPPSPLHGPPLPPDMARERAARQARLPY
ncbi:MAG: penicillin-binding protein 2 [Desulfovibrionaceae bacterium]|nr:penicillin-binding protein 2 [Desulfovibrionaceae bacterium]